MVTNLSEFGKSGIVTRGLQELVFKCQVPVVVADAAKADSPLIFVNKAFCDMTGYTSQEMVGSNCRFLQPTSGMELVKDRIRAFLADNSQLQNEFVITNVRKDGSHFLNLLHLSKLTHPNRSPLILGSQFDITTRSTRELAAYNTSLRCDCRLIEKLVAQAGWSMTQPHAALAESLERIARYEF